MAVIQSPGWGTSARNKIAGVVFASWRGVQVMRSLRRPQNPRSPGQFAARRRWWCAATQWRTMAAKFKGYFDQLGELHVPLTDDTGPMPSGISGKYTGYNLHRFAYMRGIVAPYQGEPMDFTLDPGGAWFRFDIANNYPFNIPDNTPTRIWYAARPFTTWTRGTGLTSQGLLYVGRCTLLSPIGIPPGTTGDNMMIAYDLAIPGTNGTTHIAGSSMPDGHHATIPTTIAVPIPSLPDPCAPQT